MTEFLHNQYKNLFLWMPFVMAFGAALYFSVGTEPNFHFPIFITILLGTIIYKNKNIFIRTFALFLFGFFYAMSFTHIINTPQARDSLGIIPISGTITNIDYTPDKTRLTLRIPSEQLNTKSTHKFANVRLSVNDIPSNTDIGDTISGNAKLFHPSAKYAPSSFDFARWAYFSKITATGYFTDFEIQQSAPTQNIRTYIHNKSDSVLTDSLVLGFKKTLPENESNIWKSVGIGHVWAISGFHMTLVGGWLFALFYLLFRAIPKITKRMPAKYPAIICAWFGLLFYLCISGLSVATIRAFLMTTLIFIAIIIGRNILTLRNAALVFLIIFLINPFNVMNAGFQLSFAAVFGLLWFYKNKSYQPRNFTQKILHIIYLTIMTAIIATIFTMPFIIAHFGYIPVYGLIGNLVLLPIFSFMIMPMVIIGTLLAIFNYHFMLNWANEVYQFTLNIATQITQLPHANIQIHFMNNNVLILCIIGLICLILIVKPDSKNYLIRNINYCICGAFFICAIIIQISTPKPIFYATDDHQLVAFNINDKLQFNKSRASKYYFAFDNWYALNNQNKPDKNTRYKCDHGLCRYNTTKWNLVYMANFTTILNNINNVCQDKSTDYIVTTFDINAQNCYAKILTDGLLIYPNGRITKIINRRPWNNQH